MKNVLKGDSADLFQSFVIGLAVFILGIVISLYGFFERYPLYHDEMINAYKAEIGLVFDYALRPLTYWFNLFAYEYFGASPKSLLLMACTMYSLTGLFLYLAGLKNFGVIIGVFCGFFFLLSPLILQAGIRSMPHIYSAAFSSMFLYVFSAFWHEKGQNKAAVYAFLSSIFCLLTIYSHPTMVGFLIVLFLWAFYGVFFREFLFSMLYPENISKRSLIIMLVSGLVLFVVFNFKFQIESEKGETYIEALVSLLTKIDKDEWSLYQGPWYEYAIMLFNQHPIAVIFFGGAFLALTPFVLINFKHFRLTEESRGSIQLAVFIGLFSLAILASLSLASWKFDRVLVGFYPIMILSIGLLAGSIMTIFVRRWPYFQVRALFSIIIIVAIIFSAIGMPKILDGTLGKRRDVYYRIYEVLHSLKEDQVNLIVSDRTNLRFINRYSKFSQVELIPIDVELKEVKDRQYLEGLEKAILMDGVKHLLVETSFLNDAIELNGEIVPLAYWMRSIGGQQVYSWLHRIELWSFEAARYNGSTALSIIELRAKSIGRRLGHITFMEDWDGTYVDSVSLLAGEINKKLYRFNIFRKNQRHALGYLDRNNVSVLALPRAEVDESYMSQIKAFELLLRENGWSLDSELKDLSSNVWIRKEDVD